MNTSSNESAVSHSLSDTERLVGEVWREVLQMHAMPIPSDRFFDLGGDSMTMVMAEYRIREEFAVELPADAILNAQSLRELSTLIDESRLSR